MNLYLYCLGRNLVRTSLNAVIGVAGAKPYLLTCGSITAVVSDFAGDRVPVSRAEVFAHTRVVDTILTAATPLPFRFGTVVRRERLESYIEFRKDALHAQLDRVQGCVEMSVKILRDTGQATSHPAEEQEPAPAPGPGTAFLEAKRRESLGRARQKQQAEKVAAWLAGEMGTVVQESTVHVQPTEALVVAAAYLVERERLKEYRKHLQGVLREAPADLRFLASGPWPPYSFSEPKA